MNLRKFLTVVRQIGTLIAILGELAQRLKEDELRSNLNLNETPPNGTDKIQ